MKRPPVDFRVRTDELRALASCRPRKAEREFVLAALHGPYEGLTSVAAQTLGKWGDRESMAALRAFWTDVQKRKNGWSLRRVVARAIADCVRDEDASWLLDLYFDSPSQWDYDLTSAVLRLPVVVVVKRVLQESHDDNANRRRASLRVAGCLPQPDYRALLKRFSGDEDSLVRSQARYLEQYLASKEKG